MKKIIVLLVALFSLCACQKVEPGCACTSHETISTDNTALTGDDIFWNYSNFQRIDANVHLIHADGFNNILKTYEEMEAYLHILESNSETIVSDNGQQYQTYEETINYLKTITPEVFENNYLYLSNERREFSYNKDCLSFDVMFKKGDTIYIHFYRDFYYKSVGAIVYQCYTCFIDKSVTFNDVKIVIDERN